MVVFPLNHHHHHHHHHHHDNQEERILKIATLKTDNEPLLAALSKVNSFQMLADDGDDHDSDGDGGDGGDDSGALWS